MEEFHHHHHHRHHHAQHHGDDTNYGPEGHSNATSAQNAINYNQIVVEEQHQQYQDVLPQSTILSSDEIFYIAPDQTLSGVETAGSFHSVSSTDSSAEMSKYFPDVQTPNLQLFRHPQVEGQAQSKTILNTFVTSTALPAGPYIPVFTSTAPQQLPQPQKIPLMAQPQQPNRPAQLPHGIPSHSSQIEGLSVSQALINDVLVDLQSKVINETLQQYHNEASGGDYLEPLPPIYIRAPQPTIILRSDLNRLRAELGSRVRPPVIYRHPAGSNQFQQQGFQQQFQQNTFQAPRFPAPTHHFSPQGHYGAYQNPIFASDEYKTATTTGDEYRKEEKERFYHQAESPALNVNNINDNVHSAFDLQGLSTASFDRYASPYQSTSFIPNLGQPQQGSEEAVLTSSHNFNNEEVSGSDNMYSNSARPRQEVSFDIDNCILRCFESHRQRVARRKAARQARKARHHKQPEQQQYQEVYNNGIYQNLSNQPTYPSFGTLEQTPWQQQTSFATHDSDTVHGPTTTATSAYDLQDPYIPSEAYDYTNTIQSSSGINTNAGQIPFTSSSTSNTYAPLSTDQQPSTTDYFQFQTNNVQESYVPANAFEYASHQTDPSIISLAQQSSTNYSTQSQYPTFTSTDAAVPSDIQHLIPENYQQQQIYSQSSNTFDYNAETTQSQIPTYNYQNVEQHISSQYPYNAADTQEQSSFDYATASTTVYTPTETDLQQTGYIHSADELNQPQSSSNYYQQQQQPVLAPTAQDQGTFGQPTGTVEYTRASYRSQEPIYDYQGATNQESSQYTHGIDGIQQVSQQNAYDYTNANEGIYSPSQVQESYAQSSETYNFPTGNVQSQESAYDYQNVEQISSQYPYNIQNIEQQQGFTYDNEATATDFTTGADFSQAGYQQSNDYLNQIVSTSGQYEQQPVSIPVSRAYDAQLRDQRLAGGSIPTGTVEYTRQAYFSQEPLLNNYTTENFLGQQQQQQYQGYETSEPLSINDYLKQYETETYQQQTGGQTKSSDDVPSISTIATTPFVVQQHTDTYGSQGGTQSYNLENYTNDSVVPGTTTTTTTNQPPLYSSSYYEEDQQRLLQQNYINETQQAQFQQSEQYSEKDVSSYNTYSSLPPPPPPIVGNTDYQQELMATNTSDFPAPPTADWHTYQMAQQRTNLTFPSVIPSTDQPNIYDGKQPKSPSSSDRDTDDNAKEEEEEAFDLRQCIARCYAKYQNQWNQEQQRQYQTPIEGSQQPPTTNISSSFNNDYREQAKQYAGTNEIHYNEGWTQTPVADLTKQSNFVQQTHDQTSSSFDTKSYLPQLHSAGLATDSREQQTIEYSPPLIIQARQTNPTIPSSAYEYTRFEQQQQQPIYDHTLPLPPHLSFNDNDYQSNVYFPSPLTAQPRQNENTSSYITEEQERQRYRAYSEPASIQQDTTVINPSLQPSSSQIFEQQSRRAASIPMIHRQQQQRSQTQMPEFRFLDNGRVYATEATFERRIPHIDPKTGLCLVPCPQAIKYAHLPPHLRPELFCIELPPPSTLPPVPPPPPPPPPMQQQRYCVRCCCVPGRSLIKKVVYRQAEEEQQQAEDSQYDYASVIDQLATKISVRYGNNIMEESDAFLTGDYNEKLRIIDFPVYVSGQNSSNLTPLVPVN